MKSIIFQRYFNKKHRKAGQPTFLIEAVWQSLVSMFLKPTNVPLPELRAEMQRYTNNSYPPLFAAIRKGTNFAPGEVFTPVTFMEQNKGCRFRFAHDITVVSFWPIEVNSIQELVKLSLQPATDYRGKPITLHNLCGMERFDFIDYYRTVIPFRGQLFSWHKNIKFDL